MRINNILNLLLIGCRIFIGLVFMFSGFVKGIDPLGTTYKLIDYFNAFNLGFLEPLSLAFSILLNMSEFLLGVGLVFGVFQRFFIWMVSVYMLVFTPLTFILAIYNPVTDCGCFGDAIVMTNWQTFFKNLVIVAILFPVFLNRNKLISSLGLKKQWVITGVAITGFLFISAQTYHHLPYIDFRPYKTGTFIPDAMTIPEGMPTDSFTYSVMYKKGDQLREFALEDIASIDSTWQWVETKSKLVRRGYHPPIHDFYFTNNEGENITDSILHNSSYVFLAISHKLNIANMKGLEKLKTNFDFSRQHNYNFYLATASISEEIDFCTS
ncbi:BT_3928 family protein [Plebeiibacterium marinum]|uniref:DoxX family protein n=1 Tax=Plebeiibacterium marinum TaxID=2992111 RepID=A0AAE3MFW4_9BACT|nr:BT_3928 family protein [Plebeiobacterium marinum]MCW3806701.1 DoxX family protein [Plebeiobacterium marinum]